MLKNGLRNVYNTDTSKSISQRTFMVQRLLLFQDYHNKYSQVITECIFY